jgi:hypothetical protein
MLGAVPGVVLLVCLVVCGAGLLRAGRAPEGGTEETQPVGRAAPAVATSHDWLDVPLRELRSDEDEWSLTRFKLLQAQDEIMQQPSPRRRMTATALHLAALNYEPNIEGLSLGDAVAASAGGVLWLRQEEGRRYAAAARDDGSGYLAAEQDGTPGDRFGLLLVSELLDVGRHLPPETLEAMQEAFGSSLAEDQPKAVPWQAGIYHGEGGWSIKRPGTVIGGITWEVKE